MRRLLFLTYDSPKSITVAADAAARPLQSAQTDVVLYVCDPDRKAVLYM